jgi:hypothetical protein
VEGDRGAADRYLDRYRVAMRTDPVLGGTFLLSPGHLLRVARAGR